MIYAPNDNQIMDALIKSDILKCQERKNLLLVFTDYNLENLLTSTLEKSRIPYESLKTRNDYNTIKSAQKKSKIVIGYIDFAGGLEFDNVYIVGFDTGRVPPVDTSMSVDFFTHIWYRKIYVAFTRAKKRLLIYSNITHGEHPFLSEALKMKLVEKKDL